MARKRRLSDEQSATLSLEVPLEVTLGRLIKAEVAFLGVIREVAKDVIGAGEEPVNWVVESVSEGSVRLEVRPEPRTEEIAPSKMPEIVHAVSRGFATLQDRPQRPPYFSNRALQQAKELAGLMDRDLPRIRVQDGRVRTAISRRLAANVEEILGRPVMSIGTVEGTLEAVNVHRKRTFSIFDPLTGERIVCDFGKRIPVDLIGDAVEKRVAVFGKIWQRETGEVIKVDAEELEIFPDSSKLPKAEDVEGILADQ